MSSQVNLKMDITIIFGTVALGALLIYLLLRWSDRKTHAAYATRNVPYISTTNPILAMLRQERAELTKDEIIKREKLKAFGINFFTGYTILVAEPSIAGLVFSKEFTSFTNRRSFKIDDPLMATALSNVNDDQWKRLRSIVTPTFSAGSLRRMKPRIDETIHNLLNNFNKSIKDSPNVNVKRLYGAFTMDTIIHVAFGAKVDSLAEPNNPIILNALKVFGRDMSLKTFVTVLLAFMFPKIAKFFGLRYLGETLDYFRGFAGVIIERKKEELEKNKESLGKASSFLELVLEAEAAQERLDSNLSLETYGSLEPLTKKGSKYMTTTEMVAQSVVFILAGYDTTATTITLVSYCLALHPKAQEKLYQEIESVIEQLRKESEGDSTKDPVELITFDTLPRFEYLTGVVNETLRLYPPATMTERQAARAMVLESEDGSTRIRVQKGDIIHFPIYSMHRDPEQWPEPERFNPTRFICENPTFHKYAYLPFGQGPRNCVAKSLALLEAKLAVLHTVRLFRLSRCEQTKVPFEQYYQNHFITPKDIILRVEKRCKS